MYIHVFFKGSFYKTFEFEENISQILIGRADNNDIALGFDEMISSRHALIRLEKEAVSLKDSGSKNGIFIDNQRITECTCPYDKRIYLGNTHILVSKNQFKEMKKTLLIDEYLIDSIKKEITETEAIKTLDFIYGITKKIVGINDELALITLLFQELKEQYKIDRLLYFGRDVNNKKVVLKKAMDAQFYSPRTDYSNTILEEVISNRSAVLIQNVYEEIIDQSKSIQYSGINSLIAVPMIVKNDIIGILQYDYFKSEKEFHHAEFHAISIITQIVSGVIKDAMYLADVKKDNMVLMDEISRNFEIIGSDEKINRIKNSISKVAPQQTTVLITGESGTGKELFARAIHLQSSRQKKPFVIINCASIPEHLIESELFGHVKGAFTGAQTSRTGKLQSADGGTVFLDEIGEMAVTLQAKLLRFMELGEIQPVGSNETIYTDVRIIAATNRDLKESVRVKTFREDLYFRLSVFNIHIPPLRERKNDILEIADYYLKRFSVSMGKKMMSLSEEADIVLMNYSWPGNVRELKNIIERACVIAEGDILLPNYLPDDLNNVFHGNDSLHTHAASVSESSFSSNFIKTESMKESEILPLEIVEKNYILKVLNELEHNKAKTAFALGVTRKTLYSKLKQYGI
ncbi:MAG: hypothetical protein ACD_79C01336G0004 [uncultured bacterium]|nr:MAG: hypothetical protein ACD_79C01336G0004 [uncultured bacterium]